MKQETYIRISDYIRKYKYGECLIISINKIVTRLIYMAFLILIAYLVLNKDERVVRVILVTGISFIAVSIFRHIYDEERPYTQYDFRPIIIKEKAGESMPSRHVFSAFVIAMTFGYFNWGLGACMLVLGIIMAVGRVVSGVHFPRDVIVGAMIGIISGIIGFWIV